MSTRLLRCSVRRCTELDVPIQLRQQVMTAANVEGAAVQAQSRSQPHQALASSLS